MDSRPIRLSEAIRKGALMKPQGSGSLSMYSTLYSCALGAACDGGEIRRCNEIDAYDKLKLRWPILEEEVTGPCPSMHRTQLLCRVFMLNDGCGGTPGWTREDIADWVELVEDEEELKAQGFGLTPDL